MVTTRAQARLEKAVDADDVSVVSSDDGGSGQTPRRLSAPQSAPPSTPAASSEGERLGRGCRITRPIMSLDEEYLAVSLARASGSGRGTPSRHYSEAFVVNRRYPVREAAKRAMENLHVTLTSANGAASLLAGDDEDTEETSNSMGTFHFRHHPELVEEIQKQHKRRRRRSVSSDDASDDSDSTSTSSSVGGSGEKSTTGARGALAVRGSARVTPALPTSRAAPSASPLASPRPSGGFGGGGGGSRCGGRGSRDDDAVSLDSSITATSLREESVDRTVAQDRRGNAASTPSDSEDDGTGDGTRNFANEAERRRAQRHARDSVQQNIDLNHYMQDAVGPPDARRVRRRQLDRRYRWLVHEKEEEARVHGDGGGSSSGGGGDVTTANGALGDISPLRIDDGVTFDSVGGLPEHMVTLREMVLLPLLYPDLFEQLDLRAPRGVLFVGPPGTGKTLMARALANEGSRLVGLSGGGGGGDAAPSSSSSRITFFVRKGADMLSKWVGESERQLKLLFDEAKRLQPSIIFFDEVDGLAPTRHAKTEQTQAALVATLLALMDGLEDRGQVVVIGATNRPDTLDPALRRPGRFDRELVFPLPDAAARRHILSIQLAKKALPASPAQQSALLGDLVEMTEGYSGADLGALCTEASLHRLRTALPELYLSRQRLAIPPAVAQARLHVRTEDFYAAAQLMQPSLRRCCHAARGDSLFLDPYVEVLVRGTRNATLAALAPSWSLIAKVLRTSARDCEDVASAVRALCAVPIPQPPRACLLVLQEATASPQQQHQQQLQQEQRRALQLHHLSLSLLQGLPGLHHLTVHLPQLQWGESSAATGAFGSAAYASSGGGGTSVEDYLAGGAGASAVEVDFTHMRQVVQSVRQCSPCVVYLSGAEEWLADLHDLDDDEDASDEEGEREEEASDVMTATPRSEFATAAARRRRRQRQRLHMFRYYMNMLADTDVIFLLPCATAATSALLLGQAPTAAAVVSDVGNRRCNDSESVVESPETFSFVGQQVPSEELHSANSLPPSSPVLIACPPSAVQLTRISPARQLLHPQFSTVHAAIATTPLPADLRRFVEYVQRIVTMTLRLHHQGIEGSRKGGEKGDEEGVLRLAKDPAPVPSTALVSQQQRERRRTDRAHRRQVWRKVEYRRLQLRHVLMKWVSQYIHSGKFRLLANADLDLAPDDPLCKAWRQHTRHHRVGLQDILEKIEEEHYVCLSQYHDDVDRLVRNVRSFFRTRAPQDQRYRLKALDLKETCLLNMYKMSRQVIQFCEETRDLVEPSDSDSDEYDSKRRTMADGAVRHEHNSTNSARGDAGTVLVRKEVDPALAAEQSRRAVSFSQRPVAAPKRRPRTWSIGGRRRRRRKPTTAKKPASTTPTTASVEDADVKAEEADGPVLAGESGVSADDADSGSDSGTSDSEGEDSAEEVGELREDGEDCAEGWARVLLASFSYTQLYRVFKSVMRGLEDEVRQLNERAAQRRHQQQQEEKAAEAAAKEEGEEGSGPSIPSREQLVQSVFRRLLLTAVQECNHTPCAVQPR